MLLAIPALRVLRLRPPRDELVIAAQPRIGRLLDALGVVDRSVDFERLGLDALFAPDPCGGAREWPKTLEDLLLDRRWPEVRRHLRRIYVDPFTGKPEWGLIMHGDRIVGVHSLSESLPLRTAGFPREYEQFASAASHAEWKFIDSDGTAAQAQSGARPAADAGRR